MSVHPLWPPERRVTDWTLTLDLADAALYHVKQEGRNGSIALIAGAHAGEINLTARDGDSVDTLVNNGTLSWLRPHGFGQLRVVH